MRALGQRCLRWAENNDEPRITHNGEQWLLRALLSAHTSRSVTQPFVVFDVGANAGGYTRVVLDEARLAGGVVEVHAFEPSPVAAANLRQAIPLSAPVRVVGVALSDWTGEAPLYAGGLGSSQASLVERHTTAARKGVEVRVPVQRLDDYLLQHSLPRVDLLKLDVEGLELAVLRGLGQRLQPGVVDVIQFEYGGTTRDARGSLRELHDLLVGHGYVFAKLFPTAVEVRSYGEWMDNFSYANYVALAPRWVAGRAP